MRKPQFFGHLYEERAGKECLIILENIKIGYMEPKSFIYPQVGQKMGPITSDMFRTHFLIHDKQKARKVCFCL